MCLVIAHGVSHVTFRGEHSGYPDWAISDSTSHSSGYAFGISHMRLVFFSEAVILQKEVIERIRERADSAGRRHIFAAVGARSTGSVASNLGSRDSRSGRAVLLPGPVGLWCALLFPVPFRSNITVSACGV